MSDNFTAGALVGIVATFTLYPIMVLIGAASVPFHRGSDSRSATAGVLFVARWTCYLTLISLVLFVWGVGMLVETTRVGAATVTLMLLGLAYAYFR